MTNINTNTRLVFPHRFTECGHEAIWYDITEIFKIMTRDNKFNWSVAYAYNNGGLALGEIHELKRTLCKISRKIMADPDSVVSVQLSTTTSLSRKRLSIDITFREHRTLPGEWPWYGAPDLNKESLLLWKEWLIALKLLTLEKWCINFKAQPAVKDVLRSIPFWVDGEGYTVAHGETMTLS